MGTFNESHLHERFSLDDAESDLVAGAETGTTAQISKVRAWTTIYSAKTLRESINVLIQSNEVIAASNEMYAQALNRATWVLAFFTAALVFVGLLQVFK